MTRAREIAAILLAGLLLNAPVWGAPAGALGTVVAANGASVSGAGAAVGTTIFSGDLLSTADDNGSVQLRAGGARFFLGQASAATLSEDSGAPVATLQKGTAMFSTANAKAFSLVVSTALIRPKSDDPTVGQVTLLDAKQLLVKCVRGALTITVGDDSRVIPEGSAYRIVLDPSADAQQQPPPEGAGTKGSGKPPLMAAKSKFVWYVAGGAALITFFAVQEAFESAARP